MHEHIAKLGIPDKPTGVRESLSFQFHKRRIAYEIGVRTYDLMSAREIDQEDVRAVIQRFSEIGLSSDQFLSGFLGRKWEHDTGCKNPNIRIPNLALAQTAA